MVPYHEARLCTESIHPQKICATFDDAIPDVKDKKPQDIGFRPTYCAQDDDLAPQME